MNGRSTWLAARLDGALDGRFPAPPLPVDHMVIAVDGSHIDTEPSRGGALLSDQHRFRFDPLRGGTARGVPERPGTLRRRRFALPA